MARLPIPGSDNGTWGDILNEYLSQSLAANGELKANSVGSAQLQDNAVTANTIAPNSITNAALATGAVNATSIADGSITNDLIADATIQETKLDSTVQAKLNQTAPVTSVAGKTGAVSLVKADIGLDNVDNISDLNKPISTATQTALDTKQDTPIGTPTGSKYLRDDNSWQTIPATADATTSSKGIVQLAGDLGGTAASPTVPGLAGKEPTITTGTTSQYWRGDKTFQTLDKTAVGLANVDNTTDANKPISTATQTALNTKQNTPIAPSGYIRVPGNSKFGTTDFFVMKYQAKNDGSNNAISVATGSPWVSISQRDAIDKSMAIGTNYHLITEPEWMTIATNIMYVGSNWTSGTVGTGQLYRGHSDNNPANALDASTTDSDGYYGTGNNSGEAVGSGKEQRRTLTLSNGEVIWDFAGNVWEWTDAWILGRDQPTVEASDDSAGTYFNTREWTAINKRIGGLSYTMPTNRGWASGQGLGKIYSRDDTATSNSNTTQYGFLRGGSWNYGTSAGVFALHLGNGPTSTNTSLGFRVSRYL